MACSLGVRINRVPLYTSFYLSHFSMQVMIERFSYDLEMKTREQNRNNKRTEIERFDWFIERIQTHLAFGWLSERSAEKTSCPKNFLEIALTSYYNTIGQSNNAFSILGFFWRENEESMCFSFQPLADKTNNEHLPKPCFKDIRKSLYRFSIKN